VNFSIYIYYFSLKLFGQFNVENSFLIGCFYLPFVKISHLSAKKLGQIDVADKQLVLASYCWRFTPDCWCLYQSQL